MRGRFWGGAALAIATALTYVDCAQAQEPNPNIPVQRRPHPDYDPLNIRAGAFLIAPSFSIDGLYDSNVFATENDEDSDEAVILSPRITAASQWSRHALDLNASVETATYRQFSRNNYQDFDLTASGRVDVTSNDQILPTLSFDRGHEDRSDPESQGLREVEQFYEGLGRLAYRHDFNRIFTVLRGDVTRLDYDENAGTSEEDRDRFRYGTGLRVGYNLSPRINVFVDGGYRWIHYDETDPTNRDNEGYTLRAGAGLDFTGILFGDFSVGYESVSYDSSEFNNKTKPSFAAGLTWNVTSLTSILFDGSAFIDETTVTQNGQQASGKFETRLNVSVWHELLRNVLLNGYTGWIRDDFDGIDRTDNRYRVGGGVRYLLNRNFYVDGNYTYSTRDSDVSDNDYNRQQVRIGLTARL